jgi:hypothetical protein
MLFPGADHFLRIDATRIDATLVLIRIDQWVVPIEQI